MIGQPGDPGVATTSPQASSNGAIGYVEYSWALQEGFPVAMVLNAAGYYTLPTPGHVAVSLLKDQINTDPSNPATYLTQNLSGVYTNTDPRNYELSAYSYLILPTDTDQRHDHRQGLHDRRVRHSTCSASASRRWTRSATPRCRSTWCEDGFTQLQKIPGAKSPLSRPAAIAQCNNPTFSTNGTNTLADNDPQPLACDKQGSTQCAEGVAEPTETGAQTGSGGAGSGTTGGATTSTGTRRAARRPPPGGDVDRRPAARRTGGTSTVRPAATVTGTRATAARPAAVTRPAGRRVLLAPRARGRTVTRTPESAPRPAGRPGPAAAPRAPARAHGPRQRRGRAERPASRRRHPDHARGKQRQRPRGDADGPRGRACCSCSAWCRR